MQNLKNFFGGLFGRNPNQNKQNKNNIAKEGGHKGPGVQHKGQTARGQKQIKRQPSKQPKGGAIARTGSKAVKRSVVRGQSKVFTPRLMPQNGSPPGEQLFDVCAYVIYCGKHDKIALNTDSKSGFVWFPFVSLPNSKSWTEGSLDGANIVMSYGDPNLYLELRKTPAVLSASHCMQIFRLQLPQTQKFNTRLIYCIRLREDTGPLVKCCQNIQTMKWYPKSQVLDNKVANIWGPEVIEYSKLCTSSQLQRIDEYSLDQAFFYVPRDPPRNLEEELLRSTNYTEKDVERIYGDFLEHCFPSFYMTLTSFQDYITKYGFFSRDSNRIRQLFTAFNYSNTGYLSFSEFLIGLTSIEPLAYNGQSRIKMVFKYYNENRDGFLSKKEFEAMVKDIYPKDRPQQIEKRVVGSMKRIGLKNDCVAFDDFFKACGNHKFRGTSGLCRNRTTIVTHINASWAARTLVRSGTTSSKHKGFKAMLEEYTYKGDCLSCKEKKYDFAVHTVKLDADGHCVNAKLLPEWDSIEHPSEKSESLKTSKKGSDPPSGSSISLSSNPNSSTNLLNMSYEDYSKKIVFNRKSAANLFIEKIRAFNLTKGSHNDNKGLMFARNERKEFVSKLEELCREVERIISNEDRCVRVSAPAFVIGDIHGNLEDLLTMERVLWKSVPIVSPNFVFLGDYVDRGKWSVECALYILCLKVLAPTKFFVLRGNHEVRDLQIHYTYKKECVNKYGDNFGQKVFDLTNGVFDKLPVSAVIDDAIFCAHGGIPCSTRSIDKINEIKTELRNPEKESAIAWEILWSDPIGAQQFKETAELLQIKVENSRGFLTNTKRGTAFLFGEEAANNFLGANGLTHIIRAHEVPAHGFQFHFGNKCTTIFSCSHYCGNNNEAAVVHIDQQKLRIARLDTVNNAPASD